MRWSGRHAEPSMTPKPQRPTRSRSQTLAKQALDAFERFIHIEAASGAVLLLAAIAALIWANTSNESYQHLWHSPLGLSLGGFELSRPLHFWINDALMTLFFLVVGLEIRQEMHAGALSSLRQASLPIAAALGGVLVPALVYLSLTHNSPYGQGWAVPTATDIAFALGLLALLGKGIPHNIRVFLLALAIIDDLVAILIIAFFYSGGLDYLGFVFAALGVGWVLIFQHLGVGNAWAYCLPGALVWFGLLYTGAHPTLAGVVLGLLTPLVAKGAPNLADRLNQLSAQKLAQDPKALLKPLRRLHIAQRELLPPSVRVQAALHPWVAFIIMPIFALANAGVVFEGANLGFSGAGQITLAVMLALVLGKPLGIVLSSFVMVRLGLSRLPAGVDFSGILLVGLFAGIGFTMSIFISMLAFTDSSLLSSAKLGVLLGSVIAALAGLIYGFFYIRAKRV